jgi:hypothetical protein
LNLLFKDESRILSGYLPYLLLLLASLLLVLTPQSAGAGQVSCGMTAKQIWTVYENGDRANIGSMHQNRYRSWVNHQNLFGIDEKVLEGAWYGTGDYSSEQKPVSPLAINKAYSEIIKLISDQCTVANRYKLCESHYTSIGECIAFYNNRYRMVIDRLNRKAKSIMRHYPQADRVRKAALKDFGFPEQRLLLIGPYVSDPMFVSAQLDLDYWGFEQANYLTEKYMEGFISTQMPVLVKGEFEKSVDFEKRVKKVKQEFQKLNKQRSIQASKIYMPVFINHINNIILPYYDRKVIGYDADRELFPLTIKFRNDDRSYNMILKAPIKTAKKTKQDLLANIDADNFLGTWVVAERMATRLYIRGAYLTWVARDDNKTLYRLTPVKPDKRGIEIGKHAADIFVLAYKKELSKKLKEEQQREQRTRESRCKELSDTASSKDPEKFWFIMQMNGCL